MKLGPSIRAAEKQKSVREQFFVLGSQISNSEGKEKQLQQLEEALWKKLALPAVLISSFL